MSYVEKYTVSKRGQEEGPYTGEEIVDLLRMKELSMIHKVKVGQDWVSVGDFLDKREKGELPEQNIEKSFEEVEKEAAANKEEAEGKKEPEPEPEPEPPPKIVEVPEPGPADEIHVNRAGQQFGPYLFNELKDYLKNGNLRFSDMVWFQGVPEWVPLSSLPGVSEGIKTLGAAAPPPPKPPPAPAAPPAVPPASPAAAAPPAKAAAANDDEDDDPEYEPLHPVDEEEDPEVAGLAEPGPRALAGLIDWAILLAVLGAVAGLTFGLGESVDAWAKWVSLGVAHLLFTWLYFALTESGKAMGSVGHRVAGLQIVTAEEEGRIGFGRATGRAFLKGVFAITLLLPFLVFVTRRRQGLHDLACGTVARRIPEEFSAPAEDEE